MAVANPLLLWQWNEAKSSLTRAKCFHLKVYFQAFVKLFEILCIFRTPLFEFFRKKISNKTFIFFSISKKKSSFFTFFLVNLNLLRRRIFPNFFLSELKKNLVLLRNDLLHSFIFSVRWFRGDLDDIADLIWFYISCSIKSNLKIMKM